MNYAVRISQMKEQLEEAIEEIGGENAFWQLGLADFGGLFWPPSVTLIVRGNSVLLERSPEAKRKENGAKPPGYFLDFFPSVPRKRYDSEAVSMKCA
jgi:hypothetical protein